MGVKGGGWEVGFGEAQLKDPSLHSVRSAMERLPGYSEW